MRSHKPEYSQMHQAPVAASILHPSNFWQGPAQVDSKVLGATLMPQDLIARIKG